MCSGFHRLAVSDTSFQLVFVDSTDPLLCDFRSECYKDTVTLMELHLSITCVV